MAKDGMKHPGGRPTVYTFEMAQKICDLLANTDMTMQEICDSSSEFPANQRTVYRWRIIHPEFCQLYTEARQAQADVRADNTYQIAKACDETSIASINKAKLMIDTIKWHTSKVLPKVYGNNDKQQINVNLHEKTLADVSD